MPGDTPHIPCDTWNITGTDPGISQVIPGIFQVSPGICGSPQTVGFPGLTELIALNELAGLAEK